MHSVYKKCTVLQAGLGRCSASALRSSLQLESANEQKGKKAQKSVWDFFFFFFHQAKKNFLSQSLGCLFFSPDFAAPQLNKDTSDLRR